MAKMIYRESLKWLPRQTLFLPSTAVVLSAQTRHDRVIDVWYEFNAGDQPGKDIVVAIVGTGTGDGPEESHFRFLGTCQVLKGSEVYHVYVGDQL